MKTQLFIILAFLGTNLYSQTIEQLYQDQNFQELIAFSEKTDSLDRVQTYCIGYAFFQLENDKEAIRMYKKAIEKGLDEDYIYLYKGLAERYDKQFSNAEKSFRKAIDRNPLGQKNHTELGNCFYVQSQYDSALVHFKNARSLEFELGDPYLKIPHIYQIQEKYELALTEYKFSLTMISKSDVGYFELLEGIGLLEYTIKEDYSASANAYAEILSIVPEYFELYPKLIKSYYGAGSYTRGDSLFRILQDAYEKNTLPEEMMKENMVAIAEFKWNNQKALVMRSYNEPLEMLDIKYRIYLLNVTGDRIERRLMTEKTLQIEKDGAKHLLCEKGKNGSHTTYGFGWNSDDIDFESLKNACIQVFEEKLKPAASSSFGGGSTEEVNQNEKRKRRKKRKRD